jgi:hypothetical protein
MLAVNDILDEGGLVSRLQANGYAVEISAEQEMNGSIRK